MRTKALLCLATLVVWPGCAQDANRTPSRPEVLDVTAVREDRAAEEEEVKAVIEQFLFAAGNYDLVSMEAMMTPEANLGIAGSEDGIWTTRTLTFDEYFESTRNRSTRPYYEPVRKYTIHVTDGRLAFVKADAILHQYGVPTSNNIDYFTLFRVEGYGRSSTSPLRGSFCPLTGRSMIRSPSGPGMHGHGAARSRNTSPSSSRKTGLLL